VNAPDAPLQSVPDGCVYSVVVKNAKHVDGVGVGVGDALRVIDGVIDGVTDGDALRVAVGVTVGVNVGVTDGDALRVGVGVGVGDALVR